MAQRVIDGFILEEAVVLCPECQAPFRTDVVVETKALTSTDVVEADLHRVFPVANLRGNLLSMCPDCKFCAWTSQFAPFALKPELVKPQGDIEGSKKYALAVKWAREKKLHSLDIAFIALNGLWCARESGEPDQLWLELAIFEHEKGLETSYFSPADNGITHLIMAELYRQSRNFEAAMEHYKLAAEDRTVIKEILEHQQMLCSKNVASVTALPLRIVRLLFEVSDEAAPTSKKEAAITDAGVVFKPSQSKNAALTPSERRAQGIPDAPLPKAMQPMQSQPAPANANTAMQQAVPMQAPMQQAAPAQQVAQAQQQQAAPAAQQVPQAGPQEKPPFPSKPQQSNPVAASTPAPAQPSTDKAEENDDAAPLVAAISALFSANSALLNSTGEDDDDEDEIVTPQMSETVQPISARIAATKQAEARPTQAPGQRETNPNSAPPAIATNVNPAPAAPQAPVQAKQQAANVSKPEATIDPANVIEISAYDPKAEAQKKQAERPNSAARSAALNARAKSVEAAQPAQASVRSRRRSTRKDRRSSERTPGSQNVRQEHRVTRLPLSVGVINSKGWITDYNSGVTTIHSQAQAAPAPSNYEEGLHDYEIVGEEEEKKKLPELAIDDPTGYKGEDVPDHSNAISHVENYLSFSRRLYQRNYMRGYN